MVQQTIPELKVLKPLRRKLKDDQDSWPEFELIDVDVFDEDDNRVSLFSGNTCKVVGKLEPLLEDQADLLKAKSLRQAPVIALTDVKVHSFGLDDEDRLFLRVAGQAGWYALQPSDAYKSMWEDMDFAARMILWLVYAHKSRITGIAPKGEQPYDSWPVEQLFEAYGLAMFEQPKMATEAAQLIYKHKDFLFLCMLCGKGYLEWHDTPLFLHLAKKFPRELKAAKVHLRSMQDRGGIEEPLHIRSSVSRLKRKRDAEFMAQHGPLIRKVPNEDLDTLKMPASKRADNQTLAATASDTTPRQYPSTPQTNTMLDRRKYAMKGRSALRPSAAKPTPYRTSVREPTDMTDNSDETDSETSDVEVTELDIVDTPSNTRNGHHSNGDSSTQANEDDSEDAESTAGKPSATIATDAVHEPRKDDDDLDTWLCTFSGCSHKVVAESQPDLQMLSEEHIALHAYDSDARVQLVKQLEHASLPVNHLMEKVRLQARAEQMKITR